MSDIKGPAFVDGNMHMCREDLLALELHQFKVANSALSIINRELQHKNLQWELDEIKRRLDAAVAANAIERSRVMAVQKERQGEYDAFKAAFAERYGVSLDDITYDDQTGILKRDGAPIPAPGAETKDEREQV